MPSQPKPRLNLRIVLLTFALFSAAVTLANTFWVMFKIPKASSLKTRWKATELTLLVSQQR